MNDRSNKEMITLAEEEEEEEGGGGGGGGSGGGGGRTLTVNTKTTERRYRCFCNLLHVTTATLLIGCLELCYFAYEVFSTIHHFVQTGEQFVLSLSISLFGIILAFIAVMLLFAAIRTSTPYLLVPHLLMQAAAVCVISLMCLFCIFALTAGTSLDFRIVNVEDSLTTDTALYAVNSADFELTHVSKALALCLSLLCIILLGLSLSQVWMLIAVLGCFFYLQDEAILKAQPTSNHADTDNISEGKISDKRATDPKNNYFISRISHIELSKRVETDC